MDNSKKQITAQLEDSQIRQLDELEYTSGIGRQTHIRLAIRKYLAGMEPKPENNPMKQQLKKIK